MNIKVFFSSLLRKINLLQFSDTVRFYILKVKNDKSNRAFKKRNSSVLFPPDYLMYESFQLNYEKYYLGGRKTAEWLVEEVSKYVDLQEVNILDWGCGPARIIRHIPKLLENKNNGYYATDYNKKTIEWNQKNIPKVSFNLNTLDAKLPYEDNFFDFIYGISIFTHLSEKKHEEWFAELYRVLKPKGILLLTTQGENFISKLSLSEVEAFRGGSLVVRGNVTQGHRTYSAFQPKSYLENLFQPMEIVQHSEPQIQGNYIPQDIWIVRK
ncbi:MAG: class I SAM-dependent methyltransferase [Flavobacteriales bacterium]|nr:class I SAM-dependent methyltransferase [Flavobacteriales bacterium]